MTARLLLLSPLPPSLHTLPILPLAKFLVCSVTPRERLRERDWRHYKHIDLGRPVNPGEEKYCPEGEDAGKEETSKVLAQFTKKKQGAGLILVLTFQEAWKSEVEGEAAISGSGTQVRYS